MKIYKGRPDRLIILYNDYVIYCFLYFPIVVYSDKQCKKFSTPSSAEITKRYDMFLNFAIKYHMYKSK